MLNVIIGFINVGIILLILILILGGFILYTLLYFMLNLFKNDSIIVEILNYNNGFQKDKPTPSNCFDYILCKLFIRNRKGDKK